MPENKTPEPSRRSVLQAALGTAIAAGAVAGTGRELIQIRDRAGGEERTKNHLAAGPNQDEREDPIADVLLKVNGQDKQIHVPHRRTLLLALREDLGLTGTKKSCNFGHCGACTVLMDGLPVYSCLLLALDAAGHDITTIEGLERAGSLHPVQQGFIDRMGSQCGHCTPGMILSAVALLNENPHPNIDDVKLALSGNLCRCGNYPHEIEAVLAAGGQADASVSSATMTSGSSLFHSSIPTLDAREKATGKARYAGDIGFHPDDAFQNPLFAKVLRSPYPHAEIGGIDDSRARRLPGYRGMVTFRDVPGFGRKSGSPAEPNTCDRRFLNSKARYCGDAIAAVAAADRYTAERALALLDVDFHPLSFYSDAEQNLRQNLKKIHDNPVAGFGVTQPAGYPTVEYKAGDVNQGFRAADKVIEGRYVTGIQCHVPIEMHCATAWWQGDKLTVWDSQQSVFHARAILAEALEMPEENVRVVCEYLGGGFGGKCTDTLGKTLYQAIAAVLSKKTGRPVRLEYTLKEEMFAEDTRNPFTFYMKTGVKRDGTITAQECTAIQPTGGYASSGPAVVGVAAEGIIDTYRMPNYSFRGFSVYTNSPVGGEMRGFGHPQAVFARETHLDEVADAIGMDPIEFRRRNALREGDRITLGVASGVALGFVPSEECLKRGMEAIGWDRWQHWSKKSGRFRRGLGARFSQEHSGRADSEGLVWRDAAGAYHARLGVGNIGSEAHTAIALIIAETLGIPISQLDVKWADTSDAAWDAVTDASRSVHCHGKAMYNAALDLKNQLLSAIEPRTDFTPYYDPAGDINPLLNEANGAVTKSPRAQLKAATIEKAKRIVAEGGTVGLGYYVWNPRVQSWGASFAEVEVDMETGQVKVLRLAGVHEVGRVIHLPGAEAQVHGGGIMGLGYALTEELLTDPHHGVPVNQSLYDYRPLTILDIPDLTPILVESPADVGPYGAKGLGENPMFDAAAPVANAIYNASGVRVRELPFTWARVYAALKQARRLA